MRFVLLLSAMALASLRDVLGESEAATNQPFLRDAPGARGLGEDADCGSFRLVVDLDQSGSIGQYNFANYVVPSISNLVQHFDIGEKVQIGLIRFSGFTPIFPSHVVDVALGSAASSDKSKVLDAILDMANTYSGGGTYGRSSLEEIRNQITANPHAGVDVVAFVTDGVLSDAQEALAEVAKLRAQNVTFICVGVGNQVDQQFMQQMCQNDQNIFSISDFNKIQAAVDKIAHAICNNPTAAPTVVIAPPPGSEPWWALAFLALLPLIVAAVYKLRKERGEEVEGDPETPPTRTAVAGTQGFQGRKYFGGGGLATSAMISAPPTKYGNQTIRGPAALDEKTVNAAREAAAAEAERLRADGYRADGHLLVPAAAPVGKAKLKKTRPRTKRGSNERPSLAELFENLTAQLPTTDDVKKKCCCFRRCVCGGRAKDKPNSNLSRMSSSTRPTGESAAMVPDSGFGAIARRELSSVHGSKQAPKQEPVAAPPLPSAIAAQRRAADAQRTSNSSTTHSKPAQPKPAAAPTKPAAAHSKPAAKKPPQATKPTPVSSKHKPEGRNVEALKKKFEPKR